MPEMPPGKDRSAKIYDQPTQKTRLPIIRAIVILIVLALLALFAVKFVFHTHFF